MSKSCSQSTGNYFILLFLPLLLCASSADFFTLFFFAAALAFKMSIFAHDASSGIGKRGFQFAEVQLEAFESSRYATTQQAVLSFVFGGEVSTGASV